MWSSGCPTIAPSGATFVNGSQWRNWNGALVVANLKASRLQVLRLSPDGQSVVSESAALTDRGRLRSVVQGPGGFLYVVTDSDNGSLLRSHRRGVMPRVAMNIRFFADWALNELSHPVWQTRGHDIGIRLTEARGEALDLP